MENNNILQWHTYIVYINMTAQNVRLYKKMVTTIIICNTV